MNMPVFSFDMYSGYGRFGSLKKVENVKISAGDRKQFHVCYKDTDKVLWSCCARQYLVIGRTISGNAQPRHTLHVTLASHFALPPYLIALPCKCALHSLLPGFACRPTSLKQ